MTGRSQHIGEIRLPILIERRWHADNHRFDFLDLAKIGGSVKFAGGYQLRDLRRLNVLDVALTIIEQLDFLWIGIEFQYAHA